MLLNALKMGLSLVAKVINHNRRIVGNRLADGRFAIENTHRVAVESVLAGIAKLLGTGGKILL